MAMATRFEIVLASHDEPAARSIAEEALQEISDCAQQLDRFRPYSMLSHINRTAAARAVPLDAVTFELLRHAETVREQSNGAFDVTLGSGRYFLDPIAFTVRFEHPGVTLDLGGIAKGHALERAAALMRAHGVTSALLQGGTSSVVGIGAPPDAAAWRIKVAHVNEQYVELKDAALSVSRPHSQTRGDRTHIIDPRTRQSIGARRCAVVTGPSATLAEAWSTALAVLGHRAPALTEEWHTSIELEND